MGLHFNSVDNIVLIGSKDSAGTRTSVTLESTYQAESSTVATKTFACGGYSKASFDILYTMGSGETANSIEVKIESSPDNVNFYRISNDASVAGTSTLTAREFTFVGTNAAAATIGIFLDIAYKYLRISIKETGVASTKGTTFVEVTLSGE